MKKALTLFAFTVLCAVNASATYVVVLKDGSRYNAKAKWTVVNGKAIVQLENGQSLQLDPALIDVQKSEYLTKLGITAASANTVDLTPNLPQAQQQPKQQQSSLSGIKLRTPAQQKAAQAQAETSAASAPPPVSTGAGSLPPAVIDKFDRAFEEIAIFEKKLASTGARSLRAELTADTEERVFMALSATAFLMNRNAGVAGVQIDVVELFIKTTTGGAAGRFQMSRGDADLIAKASPAARQGIMQDYFVKNVIY